MAFFIYKTTNLINGKFYIGSHRSDDPNDDYLGSGTVLKRAIAKYGKDNFKKEILAEFDNAEEMFAFEMELVNDRLVADSNCYNLKIGGYGGWDHLNLSEAKREICRRAGQKSQAMQTEEEKERRFRLMMAGQAKISKERWKEIHKKINSPHPFLGKSHSEETKAKMSATKKTMYNGSDNPSYGTCWIMKENENKKIPKTDLAQWEAAGWVKGRKIKG